jgi:alpha-L-arabinofuranosidase
VFILNRDLSRSHQVELNWEATAGSHLLFSSVLTGTDLKAVNAFDKPDRVIPQDADKPLTNGNLTKLELPPRSYSVYQWGV